MDLEMFHRRFCSRPHDRDPQTGGYGTYLNGLGHFDWWDLGGAFDGYIVGDPRRAAGRGVTKLRSAGENRGRAILANLERILGTALGQEPSAEFDIRSDCNVEMVARLLADARAGEANALPGALVLPPGVVEDRLRWLDSWPAIGPTEAIA